MKYTFSLSKEEDAAESGVTLFKRVNTLTVEQTSYSNHALLLDSSESMDGRYLGNYAPRPKRRYMLYYYFLTVLVSPSMLRTYGKSQVTLFSSFNSCFLGIRSPEQQRA